MFNPLDPHYIILYYIYFFIKETIQLYYIITMLAYQFIIVIKIIEYY